MIKVTFATPETAGIVASLFLRHLQRMDDFGFEILPTKANAGRMTEQVFMPAANEGDPVLLAFTEGGVPCGALFWVVDRRGFETRNKIAMNYGIFVEPGIDGAQELEEKLRRIGVEILREKGVDQVLSSEAASDRVGRRRQMAFGFKPSIAVLRLEIASVPPFSGA